MLNESAHVAQLVEHFLGKGEVTGSIPVAGSKKLKVLVQGRYNTRLRLLWQKIELQHT
jgi:hypothetical protein